LLLLAYSLDCADGQLARATRTTSTRGAWLDVTTDAVTLAFVAAGLCVALMTDRYPPLASLLIAGAFGASRMACLVTATWVRQDAGGFRLAGIASVLRSIFTASVDTPFVYVLLSVARPFPSLLVAVLLGSTQLSVVKFAVSARHHFRSMSGSTG
jgi:phosphatidylglycerophosphate synthase